ncbi:MAG: molybdopterin-dependent oxidoreductase alpha subunit, partial [Glaciecola sp.]
FCENGAKAVADALQSGRIGADFFARWSVGELSSQRDRWLGSQGRLTEPLVLRQDSEHYEPISWTEAFELLAEELQGLDSPDEAAFYTSGRTSNEAAFLWQLFVRSFGTNNLPDCSNMCHESSGTALTSTIGIGKGTVLLEDFDQAEAVVILGQNPGTNHPRMLTALQRAKERGAVIVSVNPLPEAGLIGFRNPQDLTSPARAAKALLGAPSTLTDHFVPVRVSGDLAFLTGVQKALFALDLEQPGAIDRAYLAEHVDGVETLEAHLDEVDWADLERGAGVGREHMLALAATLARRRNIIFCWAMGLTQHEHAVGTIQQVVNLALLRGSIGREGAGLCPVRGHSNVQGDRTMGIWERPPQEFLDALEARFDIVAPRRHGRDTVQSIQAMAAGELKIFVAMGGNFLSASPDTEATARALRSCRLTVQVSTTLNRSHLVTGRTALILPTMTRPERDVGVIGERFVTVENSMGIVHASHGHLDPASHELRSEVDIVAGIARATLGKRHVVPWSWLANDHDRIRDAIEAVVPGFDDFNVRVREPGGFALPNGPRHGVFTTPSGRAALTTYRVPHSELGQGELLLMTIRSHDQFNTHVYGDDDRYRGITGDRRVVFANHQDLDERGLRAGEVVNIVSRHDDVRRVAERFAIVPYAIPRGCLAAYFPEANAVVPLDHTAHGSNTPVSKGVRVILEPSE